jgi:transcriptional regulator with PAS, ATPase and Fis domain
MAASDPEELIVGDSEVITRVRDRAKRIAPSSVKVLVTGESGVGKDVFARYLHRHSQRAGRPFVAVNCAGVAETLLESELFGHVKGSFTGAYRDKMGRLQLADKGTIFLDEIGEMSPRMQALLLRFLENGEIHPVGTDRALAQVDVRVIAATNRDLAEMVTLGAFRRDLLYRIRVAHLHVPPLRERREDIPALVRHFIARLGRKCRFSDEAMEACFRYDWPGNIRELQGLVEQACLMATGDVVALHELPPEFRRERVTVTLAGERRRQTGDKIFDQLVSGAFGFWTDVHPLFISRDLTRHDLRHVIRRGLRVTCGNYRALVTLFRIPESDYKRFLNFLSTHDCMPDFREFRDGATTAAREARRLRSVSADSPFTRQNDDGTDRPV